MKCQNCGAADGRHRRGYQHAILCETCLDLAHVADGDCDGVTAPDGSACIDALHIHRMDCCCADCMAEDEADN